MCINNRGRVSDLLFARAKAKENRLLGLQLGRGNKGAGNDEGHSDDAHRQGELREGKSKIQIGKRFLSSM